MTTQSAVYGHSLAKMFKKILSEHTSVNVKWDDIVLAMHTKNYDVADARLVLDTMKKYMNIELSMVTYSEFIKFDSVELLEYICKDIQYDISYVGHMVNLAYEYGSIKVMFYLHSIYNIYPLQLNISPEFALENIFVDDINITHNRLRIIKWYLSNTRRVINLDMIKSSKKLTLGEKRHIIDNLKVISDIKFDKTINNNDSQYETCRI